MKAQSALSVKEANLKAMTAFIYTQGSATKQMFEHELGLSLPTITQNMRAMEATLIVKGEMQQSTGDAKRKSTNSRHTPAWRSACASKPHKSRPSPLI